MYDSSRFTQGSSGHKQQPTTAEKIYFNHSGYGPGSQNYSFYMIADSMPSMHPVQLIPSLHSHPLSINEDNFTAPRNGADAVGETKNLYNTPEEFKRRMNLINVEGKILKSQNSNLKRTNVRTRSPRKQLRKESNKSRKKTNPKSRARIAKLIEEDIWSEDVQSAFEEALALAPKQGNYKVRLDAKPIGRNGLISSYILHKTGKFRSRKQVSSHIQVVKNLGKNKSLIDFINKGPTFNSQKEEEEYEKRFYEEFKTIFADKSFFIHSLKKEKKSPTPQLKALKEPKNLSTFKLAKFEFLMNNHEFGYVRLTSLYQSQPLVTDPFLLTANFPGIENNFAYSAPIIHNKVRICPNLYIPGSDLRANVQIMSSNPAASLNCFTKVMSRGYEVLRTNEKNFEINSECDFLPSFWECLFEKANHQAASLALTLLGITVNQTLYEPINSDGTYIFRSSVRAIILWEFEIVATLEEALTISNLVQIPPNYIKPEPGIPSQGVMPISPCESLSSEFGQTDLIHTGIRAVPGGIDQEMPIGNIQAPSLYPHVYQFMPTPQYFLPAEVVRNHPSVNLNLVARSENEYTSRSYNH